MAVKVVSRMARYMRENSGAFYVQVRADPSQRERVIDALTRAIPDIWSIPHEDEPDGSAASFVSDAPDEIPSGPFLYVDMADAPARSLRAVVSAIERRLDEVGVVDATIGYPSERGLWARMHRTLEGIGIGPELVVGRTPSVRPPRKPSLPVEWVEAAVAHLRRDDPAQIWFRVVTLEFTIRPTELRKWIERCDATSTFVYGATAGSVNALVHEVEFCDARDDQTMTLGVHGPQMAGDAIAPAFEALMSVGRDLVATCDYAAGDITSSGANDPRYEGRYTDARFRANWDLWPMSRPASWFPFRSPEAPKPWPWQAFGAKWAARWERPSGAIALPAHAFELRFEPLDAWVLRTEALPEIVRQGRRTLEPLRQWLAEHKEEEWLRYWGHQLRG